MLSYRNTILSFGTYRLYEGLDFSSIIATTTPLTPIGLCAAVADPSDVIDGQCIQTQGTNNNLSKLGLVPAFSLENYAVGFRFKVADVSSLFWLFCFRGEGGADYENSGGIFAYYSAGVIYLRSHVPPVTGTNDYYRTTAAIPALSNDTWVQMIFSCQSGLDDWFVYIDGVRYDFTYESGANSPGAEPPDTNADYLAGMMPGYYGGSASNFKIDQIFVVRQDQWSAFGGSFPQSYADLVQAATGSQATDAPDNTPAQTVFDQGLSGPVDTVLFPAADQVSTVGTDRIWSTGITVRGIPPSEVRTISLRVDVVSDFSAADVIVGVCGDTPFNNLPPAVTGTFGNHPGTVTPSVGLLYDNDGGQTYVYRRDYETSQSGVATAPVPTGSVEIQVDMSAKRVTFFVQGCASHSTDFDFGSEHIRFAVCVRDAQGENPPVMRLTGTGYVPCDNGGEAAILFDEWVETEEPVEPPVEPGDTIWGACTADVGTVWGGCNG